MLILFAGCQVQVLSRCRPSNFRCRGCPLLLQGCWCQHSPWCCWCWCLVHLRPSSTHPLRKEVQGWIWLNDQHSQHSTAAHNGGWFKVVKGKQGVKKGQRRKIVGVDLAGIWRLGRKNIDARQRTIGTEHRAKRKFASFETSVLYCHAIAFPNCIHLVQKLSSNQCHLQQSSD